MRESRTYGSVRGARDETRVPTATAPPVHHAARRRGGGVAARGAPQQSERVRRIGVLLGGVEIDQEFQTRMATFRKELQRLGWIEGRNARIEIRCGLGDDMQAIRRHVAELVASAPDVIVAGAGSPGIIAAQQATQTIPVVFVNVTDPVGVGVVTSLSRPSGNMTGFV